MEWVTKSLLPPISRNVAMVGETTKVQSIMHAQHLYLIYSHSDTIYDIISHASRLLEDPRIPNPRPHVDGVVGYLSYASVGQLADQMSHMSNSSHLSATGPNAQNSTVPTYTYEVNSVQSMQPKNV
jgi:hypothetical protein